MNCFVCGHHLPDLVEGSNQPIGGTEFVAHAHYGSEITDIPGTIHIINICDNCLELGLQLGGVIVKNEWENKID